MKKTITIGATMLVGLSLAACSNQQSSTSAKSKRNPTIIEALNVYSTSILAS